MAEDSYEKLRNDLQCAKLEFSKRNLALEIALLKLKSQTTGLYNADNRGYTNLQELLMDAGTILDFLNMKGE